jgi:hypothetical protein
VPDGRADALGQGDDLVVGAADAVAREDRDPLGCVDRLGQPLEGRTRGTVPPTASSSAMSPGRVTTETPLPLVADRTAARNIRGACSAVSTSSLKPEHSPNNRSGCVSWK